MPLPSDWIETLELPWAGEENVAMADGRVEVVPTFIAYVILEDEAQRAVVAEAPTPLLGTELLRGFSLYVEFQAEGAVEIEPLSPSSS